MQEAVDPEPAERVLDPSAWTATVPVRGCELHRHIIAPLAKLDELVINITSSNTASDRWLQSLGSEICDRASKGDDRDLCPTQQRFAEMLDVDALLETAHQLIGPGKGWDHARGAARVFPQHCKLTSVLQVF